MVALQFGLDLDDVVDRDQAVVADPLEPDTQRLTVAQHLLGGGIVEGLRQHVVLEQLIVRGDDVLDFGAGFRLLQTQRVDQDALIRNHRRDALELGQPPAGAGELLQDRRRVEARRIESFKRVEGGHGPCKFFCMLARTCIENLDFYARRLRHA
ncbi:hypothetical protein FQZ97_1150240 [compost metagenome]